MVWKWSGQIFVRTYLSRRSGGIGGSCRMWPLPNGRAEIEMWGVFRRLDVLWEMSRWFARVQPTSPHRGMLILVSTFDVALLFTFGLIFSAGTAIFSSIQHWTIWVSASNWVIAWANDAPIQQQLLGTISSLSIPTASTKLGSIIVAARQLNIEPLNSFAHAGTRLHRWHPTPPQHSTY